VLVVANFHLGYGTYKHIRVACLQSLLATWTSVYKYVSSNHLLTLSCSCHHLTKVGESVQSTDGDWHCSCGGLTIFYTKREKSVVDKETKLSSRGSSRNYLVVALHNCCYNGTIVLHFGWNCKQIWYLPEDFINRWYFGPPSTHACNHLCSAVAWSQFIFLTVMMGKSMEADDVW